MVLTIKLQTILTTPNTLKQLNDDMLRTLFLCIGHSMFKFIILETLVSSFWDT